MEGLFLRAMGCRLLMISPISEWFGLPETMCEVLLKNWWRQTNLLKIPQDREWRGLIAKFDDLIRETGSKLKKSGMTDKTVRTA